jgi:hypothetical protein
MPRFYRRLRILLKHPLRLILLALLIEMSFGAALNTIPKTHLIAELSDAILLIMLQNLLIEEVL